MRVPARSRRTPLAFNLTPMIDVVFNLIIFFLVASHFSRADPEEDVSLPTATQASEPDPQPRRLVITIRDDGAWRVAGESVTLEQIEQMLAEGAEPGGSLAVNLRGDRAVPYRFVEPLLLACARHGVTSVSFHVQPQ
ncbi:MAG: biopolymer transporter ExbD [Planctomyces sp.]|nr:biopolymer transporter ExbD [Planctomyces sp.]